MSADGGNSKIVEMKARETEPKAPIVAPAVAAAPAPVPAPEAKPKRGSRRFVIMAIVPAILVAVGLWFWLTGGRYASTDNAYVQQDRVTITADIPGRIVDVAVKTNQHVKKGDLLFRLDPEPYRITLAEDEAALASARLSVEQLRSTYQMALTEEQQARTDVDFAQRSFDRQQDLLKKGVASQATYDQAEQTLRAAEKTLTQATEKASSAVAGLGGDPNIKTDQHPAVLAAIAKRDQAALDLAHTETRAPVDGVVSQTGPLQVGGYVSSPQAMPTALLSLVETGDTWVDANFKETDLTKMLPGQKATIWIDAYPGHTYQGEVASIGAGTGSMFSVLPAQNATGNWVKVVQRVPVRIRFSEPTNNLPLRMGLSASVEVDTESGAGSAAAAEKPAAQ
jgi:membrane fusion protein (multidrug efflux system)